MLTRHKILYIIIIINYEMKHKRDQFLLQVMVVRTYYTYYSQEETQRWVRKSIIFCV